MTKPPGRIPSSVPTPAFTFIDLFAGIGGFAAALGAYGGECVYAVEVQPEAAKIYYQNWLHDPLGDITKDANDDVMIVPEHDVLVAGFPCQPFSKSGAQLGMEETRGTLYWNILKIIEAHHPKVVILENVRNLAGPRHRHEWNVIIETLREAGYRVSETPAVFSPHLLPRERGGRPQIRERVFITATHNPDRLGKGEPVLPVVTTRSRVDGFDPTKWNLERDLPLDSDERVTDCDLTATEKHWINAWDAWVVMMRPRLDGKLPGYPVWVDEWKTLGYLKKHPIPSSTPPWKRNFLIKNATLYTAHREVLDAWVKEWGVKTEKFPPSRRKFEWQAQDTLTLWENVMHFRPSGIRAKRATYVPALVAITQTSIVGSRRRRLSPREAARLQGLPEGFDFLGQSAATTYRQLGNGVNVGVVWHVLREHVKRDYDILETTAPNLLSAVMSAPNSPDERIAERLNRG